MCVCTAGGELWHWRSLWASLWLCQERGGRIQQSGQPESHRNCPLLCKNVYTHTHTRSVHHVAWKLQMASWELTIVRALYSESVLSPSFFLSWLVLNLQQDWLRTHRKRFRVMRHVIYRHTYIYIYSACIHSQVYWDTVFASITWL